MDEDVLREQLTVLVCLIDCSESILDGGVQGWLRDDIDSFHTFEPYYDPVIAMDDLIQTFLVSAVEMGDTFDGSDITEYGFGLNGPNAQTGEDVESALD